MSRTDQANPSSFPHWVALTSLGLVLWLFFGNTVPALQEREQLISLKVELQDLWKRYDTAIRATQFGSGVNKDIDFQSLLVAIDQRCLTPAELLAAYREPPVQEGSDGPSGSQQSGRSGESGQRRAKFQ